MVKRNVKSCISIFLTILIILVSFGNGYGVKKVSASTGVVTQFDIADGDITIADAVTGSAIKVSYGAGPTEEYIDPATMLTITGSSAFNKVVINTSNDRTVNITLSSASIELFGVLESPFELQNNSVVNLTLSGINTLAAGVYGAGLNVPANASVTIGGSGELTATGGSHGAGIGGKTLEAGGNITITGGTVRATSPVAGNGTGIGGGSCRAGGTITITGGTVVAKGGSYGAGIGGGGGVPGGDANGGAGGNVTISGGNVTAIGGNNGANGGAGIGGGRCSTGGMNGAKTNLNISNTASVMAAGLGVLIKGEAIEAVKGSVIDANILMADYSGCLIPGQYAYVKDSTGNDLSPAVEYDNNIWYLTSIAFTVPSTGEYTLFTDTKQQRQGASGSMSHSFSINTGLNIFTNVQNVLNLSIDYPGEKLTGYDNDLTGFDDRIMEYSTDGVDYITDTDLSGSISGLIPAVGAANLNLKVREAQSPIAPSGDAVDITVPARPAPPAASTVTISAGADETHTNITLANTYEYYIGDSAPISSTVWTTGSGTPAEVAVTDGQKVYIRTKATDHSFVSDYTDCGSVRLGVADISLAGVGYNVAAGKLTGTTVNMEYQLNGGTWNSCMASDTTGITFIEGAVKVRQKNKITNVRNIVTLVEGPAPGVTRDDTANKIVGADASMEYSTNGGSTWLSYNPAGEPTFTGNKTVLVRLIVTETDLASHTKTLTFQTEQVPSTPSQTPELTPELTPTPPTTEQIKVDVKEGYTDTTASQITVSRTTDSAGIKSDTVTYQEEKAIETVDELKKAETDVARIVIPDSKDEISKTTVNIPSASLKILSEGEINLQIDTEEVKISVPKEALQNAGNVCDENLYFNIVPVKDEKQKEAVSERALSEVGILSGNSKGDITVVSVPVTIETNMPSSEIDITLPLTGITLPVDPSEREDYLNQLAVYVEHSDGDKELLQGEIVEYSRGVLGISFHIMKFSTFTIVNTDTFVKSSECKVISITEPSDAIIKGADISAGVANKASSITVKAVVSDKAVWGIYSDKACTKELINRNMKLKTGKNKAYLKITAEDGTVKIYTMTVYRYESSEADVIKVNAPNEAVLKGKDITATAAFDTDTIIIKAAVSEKAVWKLYSDKACTKELTDQRMALKAGANKAYLKVTAQDGKTSKVYIVNITREAAPAAHYNTHIKLGLIGSRTYAEEVVKIFGRDYNCDNITVKKEGKYYRIYLDFTDITAAKTACKDMIKREYIISYYFCTK